MNMNGMTASSASLSAFSWDAILVKTARIISIRVHSGCAGEHTQAWREKHHVEVCNELLGVRVEHALAGNNVSRKTHTYYLEHSFEHEKNQVTKRGM